ncbi:unnamed protein product, partial [Mesorhabditis spiculigera]
MFNHEKGPGGKWRTQGQDLMVFTADGLEARAKVAAFDMDGTIITPKSGKVFPKDAGDWRLLFDEVAPKLKSLHEGGEYKIVFFSNQSGISKGHITPEAFKGKIEAIARKLGVPIQVFLAQSKSRFRKPCTGMWEYFLEHCNDGLEVDMKESYFVGDAAGRHKTKSRPKKDHAMADRLFARNVGLKFYTPEQYFLGEKEEEPWGPISFEAAEYTAKALPLLEPKDSSLASQEKEVIVLVGFPGSGKSTLARKLAEDHGYKVVNRDTLGTWQKCVQEGKAALMAGQSVVVDNTNPDVESRERYLALAKGASVPCRCISHNIRYRLLRNGGPDISTMVLRMHNSKLKEPTLDEGFTSIIRANFVPEFDNEDDRRLWTMCLNES